MIARLRAALQAASDDAARDVLEQVHREVWRLNIRGADDAEPMPATGDVIEVRWREADDAPAATRRVYSLSTGQKEAP